MVGVRIGSGLEQRKDFLRYLCFELFSSELFFHDICMYIHVYIIRNLSQKSKHNVCAQSNPEIGMELHP
jgi:hypothetical protein